MRYGCGDEFLKSELHPKASVVSVFVHIFFVSLRWFIEARRCRGEGWRENWLREYEEERNLDGEKLLFYTWLAAVATMSFFSKID